MTAYLSPVFDTQFFDGSTVAAGYKLYTYDSGTTTPKAVYSDQAGVTPHTNPITLDADGRVTGQMWLGSGEYTFVLKTSGGTTIKTWNDVGSGLPDGEITDAKIATGTKLINRINDLNDVLDPSYGVTTNGSTDYSSQIQDFADDIGGGSQFFPAATYNLGAIGLTVPNRHRMSGEGMPYLGTSTTAITAPTALKGTGTSIIRFGDASTFGTQGSTLENVEINGGGSAASGIIFNGTAGSNAGGNVLRNVHINRFTAYGLTGVAHSFVNTFENVSASNCLIGVYLQEECNDWTFISPKLQANGQNFVIGKGSGTSQSAIRLIAPKSEDATNEGILIQNPTRSIDINGLYSEGNGKEGIKNLATSSTISITGGELNGPSGTYSHINLAAGCIFDIEGVSFTGDAKNDIELSGGGNFYGRIGPCRHGSTNVGAKINYSGAGSSSIVEVFDTSASEHFFVYGSTKSYGTFTPVAKGSSTAGAGTYTTQVGEYTRVQNRVHFSLNLVVTAHTGTGNLRIDLNDIPWTPSSTTGRVYPVTIHADNLTFSGQLCATISPADKTVYLRQMSTGAASSEVAIDATFTLNISGSYPV